MSAIVDYTYYSTGYMGSEADQVSFPALYAHAIRTVGVMTRWQVTEANFSELPEYTKEPVRLAICAQIDFLAINGLESMSGGETGGFTVGKVTVQNMKVGNGGGMNNSVSPAVIHYLEQTGLMNRDVSVADYQSLYTHQTNRETVQPKFFGAAGNSF